MGSPRILVVYGRKGSGKTTFINAFRDESRDLWYQLSLYDPLYRIADLIVGRDSSKFEFKSKHLYRYNMTGQQLLLALRKALYDVHPNIYLNFLSERLVGGSSFIIKDAKSTDELNYLRSRGACLIRISNKSIDDKKQKPKMQYSFDHEITNDDSIIALSRKAREFLYLKGWL